MREILFRGQTRKNGEKVEMATGEKVPGHWVYGGIFPGTGDYSIIYGGETEKDLERHVVYSETVGQYTGLKDKHGKRIFEGDIVFGLFHYEVAAKGVVTFRDGAFGLRWNRGKVGEFSAFKSICNVDYKVIGNIHDNPELMEEENNETD